MAFPSLKGLPSEYAEFGEVMGGVKGDEWRLDVPGGEVGFGFWMGPRGVAG